MTEAEFPVLLTLPQIEGLLDWTEGDTEAADCGDGLCFVCEARERLKEAMEKASGTPS